MRNINSTFSHIKTFEPFVNIAITQKNTLFGVKLKLVCVEWTEIGPTSATKSVQANIIGFFLEHDLKRGGKIQDLGRKPIDQVVAARNDSSQYFRGILA
jgi:hypothetical protein